MFIDNGQLDLLAVCKFMPAANEYAAVAAGMSILFGSL